MPDSENSALLKSDKSAIKDIKHVYTRKRKTGLLLMDRWYQLFIATKIILQEETMSKSVDDLKAAFAGESQANRKYLAFAKKADEEGYPQAAKLFRAAAEAETVHAHNHLKAMDGVGSTLDNLKEAMGGETYEFETMYPPMVKDAEADDNKKALRSFTFAMEVEKVHAAMYKEAISKINTKEEVYDYFVCPVCGFTAPKYAPEKCPVCGAPGTKFTKVA
jgi:rubrerythrin